MTHHFKAQQVTIHIMSQQDHGKGTILLNAERLCVRYRCVIDGKHRDRHRCGGRAQSPVVGHKANAVLSIEICIRRIPYDVCLNLPHRSEARPSHHLERDRVAFEVRSAQDDVERLILRVGHRLVVRNGRVVHGVHRDRHRGLGRFQRTVRGLEGERIRAAVVVRRRVGHLRRAAGQHAIAWRRRNEEGDRVVVRIRTGERDAQGRVFIGLHVLRIRLRRAVWLIRRDRHLVTVRLDGIARRQPQHIDSARAKGCRRVHGIRITEDHIAGTAHLAPHHTQGISRGEAIVARTAVQHGHLGQRDGLIRACVHNRRLIVQAATAESEISNRNLVLARQVVAQQLNSREGAHPVVGVVPSSACLTPDRNNNVESLQLIQRLSDVLAV